MLPKPPSLLRCHPLEFEICLEHRPAAQICLYPRGLDRLIFRQGLDRGRCPRQIQRRGLSIRDHPRGVEDIRM